MTLMVGYLEDFGSAPRDASQTTHSEEVLENERLEAFDKGYRAGWDDALEAKSSDEKQVSSAFAQNLQDLSFTYHEAHAQVLQNLAPLFDEILQKTLPALARETLGQHIAEQLAELAKDAGTIDVSIVVPPGSKEEVSQLIDNAGATLPVSIKEAASLGPGQAEMHLGGRELSIDLAGVTEDITRAVRAALYQETEVQAHG